MVLTTAARKESSKANDNVSVQQTRKTVINLVCSAGSYQSDSLPLGLPGGPVISAYGYEPAPHNTLLLTPLQVSLSVVRPRGTYHWLRALLQRGSCKHHGCQAL